MSSGDQDRRRIPLDKIIFVIACAYLGSVVAWLISQKNAAVPPKSAISPENSQFIAYLQSSLQVIDRQSKTVTANKATPVSPSPSPNATMPPPPPTNLPANSPRVIERVYVPVYPQTPQIPPQQTPATPPKIAVAPPTQNSPIVNPPQVALIIPTNDKIKNTLVGVMELGDRSAALFDNQGITARISTGEFINGWTLIGVQNQQVILSRNGKTKVVEVGQSF
jgi:hypothetical protein